MFKRMGVIAVLGASLVVAAMVLGLAGSAVAGNGDRTMYKEGTGVALVYPFWVADGQTDTLFEMVNRLTKTTALPQGGVTATGNRTGKWVLVKVRIREEKNSEDVKDFEVCLSPGDVWTGTLTLVGGRTTLKSKDLSDFRFGPGPPPDSLLNLDSSGANPIRGYIEAVLIDIGTTKDTGCNNEHSDLDFSLSDSPPGQIGSSEPLFGRELFVNVGNGLATGFNAEALEDLGTETDLLLGSIQGSKQAFRDLALGDSENEEIVGSLMGRWIRDKSITPLPFDTQVVVTFPTGKNHKFDLCSGATNPFGSVTCNLAGGGGTITPFDFSITKGNGVCERDGGTQTCLALWIRNDEECVNQSPRQVPIPNEVNVFTFSLLQDLFFDVFGPNCGTAAGKVSNKATAGWFRLLYDTNEDEVTDFVKGVVNTGTITAPNIQTFRVPRVLPVVGFVTLTAPTSTVRISATFPFQTERPQDRKNCNGNPFNCN